MQLAVARANAVFEHDDIVAEIARAARCALDAAFGGDTADYQRLDAVAAQYQVEVGADKSIGTALLKNDILWLWLQLGDDLAVMGGLLFRSKASADRRFWPASS